mmetsp:Transcript_23372/g.42982  ORF Transcript_23372/g.42982 Transcript_23372/m.42982 type:complete len:207 (+) Transcript_23372:364-984(+)
MEDMTYAHSVVGVPARPAKTALPNRAPAMAMDKVALPLPFFAATTTVPASCTFLSRAGISASGIFLLCSFCENTGRIVVPAWPPMTGMLISLKGAPVTSWTNFSALTTSKVVMPTILHGLRPFFFQSSHIAGTTEFTGLTIKATTAFGQYLAHASTMFFAMPALMLSRSFLSWPGFLGTPAGTSTKLQPVKHSPAFSMALSSSSNA